MFDVAGFNLESQQKMEKDSLPVPVLLLYVGAHPRSIPTSSIMWYVY